MERDWQQLALQKPYRGRIARAALGLLACTGALSASLPARAAGFATARFGGEHGNVTTFNPTALYYNPAGIAWSKGIHLFADGTLALRQVSWEHPPAPTDPVDPPDAEGADSGRAEAFNVFGAPMFGATGRWGDFAAGLALSVPFGGRLHWSKNENFGGSATYPLAADGVQRWHSIEGELTFLCSTAGLAYRFGPLGVGATFNLFRSSVRSVRARNPNGQGLPDVTHEGRTTLDVSGTEASFGLGAMFEAVHDRLWLGLSYQAQPGLGPIKLSGKLNTVYLDGRTEFPVIMTQALPDSVRVGARYRATDDWEMRLSGDWTHWSLLMTQCVAIKGYPCAVTPTGADASAGGVQQNLWRDWHDTYALRAGASHWFNHEVELFFGIGGESTAVPDATLDPEIADAPTIWGAGGTRLGLWPKLFVAVSYTHIYYFERNNIGKSQLAQAEYPTTRPDGGGIYRQWIGIFNANVEKEF